MDGIEKITGRIAADTEAEIASIQAEARRQADEITARYEAQAKREAEEIAARGRRSAEERQARLASVAQLDARKLELAAKQEMLAKAYDRAMERLTRLLPPEAGATIREIWEEYEACQTPEARWVKALDKAETIIQHNQGANPAGFDYAFNLTYGSEYFDDGALLSDLRLLLDEETGRHVRR